MTKQENRKLIVYILKISNILKTDPEDILKALFAHRDFFTGEFEKTNLTIDDYMQMHSKLTLE